MSDGFRRVPSVFTRRKLDRRLDLDGSLDTKIDKLFNEQPVHYEHLVSEPKHSSVKRALTKAHKNAHTHLKSASSYVNRQPALVKVIVIAVIATGAGVGYIVIPDKPSSPAAVNEVAGVQNTNQGQSTDDPSFSIVTPGGKKFEGIERTTPSNTQVFSYKDTIDSVGVEVTQQPMPESFSSDRDNKLQQLANSYYMGSIIQIDDNKIYHGLSEKTGTQSVVLIKGDVLIFMRIDKKVSDDALMEYIVALK